MFAPLRSTLDWLGERTGVRTAVRSQLTDYRVPRTINRWYSLGFVLLVFVALQVATGILLLVYYVPDAERAFESVQRLMNEIPFGWLIRQLHVHGANAIMIALLLHMLSVAVMGSYKRPRELHWVTGCLILFTMLGLCFTGYLLPWSQLSYWATTVGMNITGSAPLVGPLMQRILQGGEVVGPDSLGRAFALHVGLLPLALAGLIGVHLYLVRHAGVSSPPSLNPPTVSRTRRFFPDVALEDLTVALFALSVFSLVLFLAPNLYLPAEAFVKADPFVTPSHVKPEWYFLGSYAVLRLIPDKTLGIVVQGIAIAGLVLLPFIDRGERKHIFQRPVFFAGLCGVVMGLVALTVLGALV